jgi:two-component system, cell cycle response regulator
MLKGDSFFTEKAENTEEVRKNTKVTMAYRDHKDLLKQANRIILNQHMAVTEEHRLNVLFQLLGIAFHELNQPLTSLLGNIELMLLNQDNPEKLNENIKRVEDAGKRFSTILRKIQNIRQGKTLIQDNRFCPMKTNKVLKIEAFIQDEKVFRRIQNLIKGVEEIVLVGSVSSTSFDSFNIKDGTDLVILDEKTLLWNLHEGLVRRIRSLNNELPIVAVLRNKNEKFAFSLIQAGVDDYCSLAELDQKRFNRILSNVKEKAWARHQLKSALNDLAGVSIPDEQTGLFQRRFFSDALDRETTMAKRKESPFIACRFDIEGIIGCSRSNGGNGQAKALIGAARVIQNNLGDVSDLVCRYGKESFAFILSSTGEEEARRICQGLQLELENHLSTLMSHEITPRIHVGMILFTQDHDMSAQELQKKLDEAITQAKITGQSPVLL